MRTDNLKIGETYKYTNGAELLYVKYIGKTDELFVKPKISSSNGKGYLFELKNSPNQYFEMGVHVIAKRLNAIFNSQPIPEYKNPTLVNMVKKPIELKYIFGKNPVKIGPGAPQVTISDRYSVRKNNNIRPLSAFYKLELVLKNYGSSSSDTNDNNKLDIIIGYLSEKNVKEKRGTLYLGYWNDGVI